MIAEKGRSSGIGRPILYGTTDEFLKYFGFETIKDLPDIDIDLEDREDYENIIMKNQLSIEDIKEDMNLSE